jgi:hypothetical protein
VAAGDLLFQSESATDGHLVFGETGEAPSFDIEVSGGVTLVRPAAAGVVQTQVRVTGGCTLVRPTASGEVTYRSDTSRPTVAEVRGDWQDGHSSQRRAGVRWQASTPQPTTTVDRALPASPLPLDVRDRWRATKFTKRDFASRYQDGQRLQRGAVERHQDAVRLRADSHQRFQDALPVRRATAVRHQDALRAYRPAPAVRWQDGSPQPRSFVLRVGSGTYIAISAGVRYQDAKQPDPGRSYLGPPIRPPVDPCYLPNGHLVFESVPANSGHLVFWCELQDGEVVEPPAPEALVIVPVRSIYVTINSATLVRVSDNAAIPTYDMSMSLDVDSWTWTFSASVPGASLPLVQSSEYGEAVVVQATINGVAYRFLVEQVARERTFGKSSLRIAGRGLNAQLDAPYAPTLDFTSTTSRTMQQLLNHVLTLNGVPIGWTATFGLTDWSVPGNTWSHQGTYISALNNLAAGGGGYVQPHRTLQQVSVLPRYPVPAWEFHSATPDYELPSAVTTRESIEWVDRPEYNRVFVVGQANGVLGRYTRLGTDGALRAPTVVDPLITANAAVRQRGRSILSAGGRVATVGLRLPVLSATGIIPPGKFVRYVDGATTRIGITRAVSVNVNMPTIYQTLQVETHVY